MANPDLPIRFELHANLNEADRTTMYGGADKGYTDYPFLDVKKYQEACVEEVKKNTVSS
jgi:N-ethylmaleimide reductase